MGQLNPLRLAPVPSVEYMPGIAASRQRATVATVVDRKYNGSGAIPTPGPTMKSWKKMAGHGGPRPGSGRPKGGHNRLPSKSTELLERLYEQVEPEYNEVVRELMNIALGRATATSKDPLAVQLRAIEYILDRLMGKAPEYHQLDSSGDSPTAAGLLDHWKEGQDNGPRE